MFIFVLEVGNKYPPSARCGWASGNGKQSRVIEREYFVRQAMWFLKFAKSIKNPELAAALIEKAADLHSQTDETMPPPDTSPQAPDIEPRA